jgi:hypothetical protein
MFRILALKLVLLVPSLCAADSVIDGAKLFGDEAKKRAANVAAAIEEQFGIQVVIETMDTPPVKEAKLKGLRSRELIRRLREAAQDRADDLAIDGLYVLITTDPQHVTVVGWPAGRERQWQTSDAKREEFRRALAKLSLKKDNDYILIRAIEEYRAALGDPERPSPLNTYFALVLVGGLVGGWILLLLARSRMVKAERPLPIYQPAMLGSLFGVPAGFWVHDRLFQKERPVPEVDLSAAPRPGSKESIMLPNSGDEP